MHNLFSRGISKSRSKNENEWMGGRLQKPVHLSACKNARTSQGCAISLLQAGNDQLPESRWELSEKKVFVAVGVRHADVDQISQEQSLNCLEA